MIKRSCKSIEKSLDMFVYVNLLINYIFSSEKKNECTYYYTEREIELENKRYKGLSD